MNSLAIDEDTVHQKQKLAQRKLLVATVICFFCAAVLIAVVVAVVLSVNGKKKIQYTSEEEGHNENSSVNIVNITSTISIRTSSSVNSLSQETTTNEYSTEILYSKGMEIQTHLLSTPVQLVSLSIAPTEMENTQTLLTAYISSSFHSPETSVSTTHAESSTIRLPSESSLSYFSSSFNAISQLATSDNFILPITSAIKSTHESYIVNSDRTSMLTSVSDLTEAPYTDLPPSVMMSSSLEVLHSSEIQTRPTTPPSITLPACSSDEFHCASGQCVPGTSRCDRYTQCQDKSDEYNCPDCMGFQCINGLCLWSFIVQCNGQVDCDDLSDEMDCAPRLNQRRCDNSLLIYNNQWCDGVDNCYDNSDETNCSCNPVYEHQCNDGACVRQEWVCDGYVDCTSDETNCANCSSDQYTCPDYSCIHHTLVCDGQEQCPRGRDEENCISLLNNNGTGSQKVQVLLKGQNYSVCSSNWTTEWSNVICRELGESSASKTEFVRTEGNEGSYLVVNEVGPQENSPLTSQFMLRAELCPFFSCNNWDFCSQWMEVFDWNFTHDYVLDTYNRSECGMQSTDILALYIAGGDLVLPGRWPWVVSLSYLGHHICGGALISRRWVLTAGHCVALPGAYNYTNTPNFIEVTLGSVERSRSLQNHSVRYRSDLIFHYPDLTPTGLGLIYWDIALVRLERPVKFTTYKSPICLPSVRDVFSETDTCYLAGWGFIGHNQATTPQLLREAKLKIWNPEDCRTNTVPMEPEVNTTFTLCAGYSTGILSGCQGDSGGPLMCLSSRGRWTLAGVMSSGSNVCGLQTTLADRFTKTSAALSWIENIITKN